ncbi:Bromodomain adjacent to zinc finger domain protein 1A [Bagarius yarrelli]|uniref:Bromodomain adjacent to zinc finger domain protein 1A n=1 Tax=Bagarius yarrelli TaxID=175774 RepID=A0A556U982_BAGYA|nr:Bromodomain adjacent to zinc finger domain protein 1A [Bagarius yarrelli]
MFPSETLAIQKTQQNPKPTVHVDAFLYDEETVDSLCEDGKMSRNFCLSCGSHRTAPMEFISHSFSISELQFLFLHALPDLAGKLVVDVGSRLGVVLFGGYLYSAAAQLVGVEICEEFVKLQTMTVEKYGFSDRIQVIHADICSQTELLQNADVLIMNNVFEYFMEPKDQLSEFFERTILCNSLVWSCAVTGKPGLTYQEALESEKKAKLNLKSFPKALLLPLLHLTALTQRTRLHEICDDICSFIKERFFSGEMVDIVSRSGARQHGQILEVIPPHANGTVNGHVKHCVEGDSIIISDSDDDIMITSPVSPKTTPSSRKRNAIKPSMFKYKIQLVSPEGSEPIFVKSSQIVRKKNVFTRDRLKLLLKQHCEPVNGIIRLKTSTVATYKLSEQSFSHFFPDEAPVFVFSPPGRGRGHALSNGSPVKGANAMRAAEEKLKLMQQKEEMIAMAHDKAKTKKEREDLLDAKRKEKEDKERRREEIKRMLEEEKRKRKEEREREREKLKEEKKKYAERLKLWSKPREDMECDDLKELPAPVPVKTRLPPELFGDALMVLEFLNAFGELFDLKDEFPEGITLEVLEEALVGCDPEGPLCELLFFFLSAIFQAQDEEQEEVANEQVAESDTKDLIEVLDDDSDPTQSAISAVASLAAAWPQLHQGCSLKKLDLDSCTLSEILRLHILASGAECNNTNAKFRYQKQGGFSSTDDPCVELRLSSPSLLKKLSSTAVYDLLPGEKLKLLHALCGKLLTLISTRDFIEDCADEQRAAKMELRELKAEQHRREREEAANRVRKRKEEKLKEQEQKLKEKHEKLKLEEVRNGTSSAGDEMDTSTESQEGHADQTEDEAEQMHHGKSKNVNGSTPKGKKASEEELKNDPSPEELQQQQLKERELLERIHQAAACTYILPLGRDRLYRRYWVFPSAGALFVEDDFFGLTEDMLEPRPVPEPKTEDLSNQSPVKTEEQLGEHRSCESTLVPVKRPNQWAFYSTSAELEQLIEALNPRGHRESALKDTLVQEKARIIQMLINTAAERYHHSDKAQSETSGSPVKIKNGFTSLESTASAERCMENRLRDLLLDIEDRIYQGTLGSVKVMERGAWRTAMESGNYDLLTNEDNLNLVLNGEEEAMEIGENHNKVNNRLQELRSESQSSSSTSAGTPQPANNNVHYLARALAQIEQGIERKFLKAPLGDEESKKDQKTKKKDKKKDDEQSSEKDDGSECGRQVKTVLERWRESLLTCSSLSQLFLHLSTLERSVLWAKSILNARCKVCRRKGDSENMLLCDGCDRGHHIYCVRPKLKAVPSEDWFCPECRPKQRSHRINSRQRSSIDSEEELEEVESEEELEESEDEEEEEFEDDESEVEEKESSKKAAVKLPLQTKGVRSSSRSRQVESNPSAPQSQQNTPKQNNPSVKGGSKSTGKKATPVSNSKPPPRAGSRSSARLSLEVLNSNGTSKKSSPQPSPVAAHTESRKRAGTAEVSPQNKMPSAPSSSSSNRRCSGRNFGVHELSVYEQLTVDLVRHEDSWPFMKLVSKTQVPDYYDIIKKPIALSIIRERVNNCEYQTASEFIDDVKLMFSNCFEYNPSNTSEAKAGTRLQAFFHSELQRLGLAERTSPPQKRSRI